MADHKTSTVTTASEEPRSNWTWAKKDDLGRQHRNSRMQPYMSAYVNNDGRTLNFNGLAVKELGIEKDSRVGVGYDAENDCLGFRPNVLDENGIMTGIKSLSLGRWLIANFGFRLLDKEAYRIEKNEPGVDPPYIIPLNGRRKPV